MRVLRYPHIVDNVQGDSIPYRKMNDTQNIHEQDDSVGHWGNSNPGVKYAHAIAGKNGSRNHPSTIKCSDFQFNYDSDTNKVLIPDYAHVTGIIVQYAYRKKSYSSSTAHGSFGNPEISIPKLGLKGTGNAPPRNDFTEYNVYFGNLDLRGSDVNTSNFSVLFDLPANTSTNPCWIEMKYLRVYIDYDLPNYIPSISLNKSELKYGETLQLSCRLNETNNVTASEQCNVQLTIPSEFNIIESPSTFNKTTKIWNPVTRNHSASMDLKLQLASKTFYGDFLFKIIEKMTNNNTQQASVFVAKQKLDIVDFYLGHHEITVSEGNNKHYASLEIQVRNPTHEKVELELNLDGLNVKNAPSELNLDTGILTITEWDVNDLYDIQLLLYSETVGDYTVSMISDSFIGVFSDTLKVHLPDTLEPYYTLFALDSEALSNLEDGQTYTFGCLCKITGTTTSAVKNASTVRNLRASIINGNDEIFTNQLSQAGEWELLKCEFTYNPNKQIFCKFYGNFTTYNFGEVHFGDLFLIRSDRYSGYEYPTLKFRDTSKLLTYNTFTDLLLEPPENNPSTKHYFSVFDFMGLIGNKNLVLHGLSVSGEISVDGDTNIILGFGHSGIDEYDYNVDTVHLNEKSNSFSLGGKFQSFGIPFNKLLDVLEDMRFYLQVDDVFDNTTPLLVSMRNVSLTVYYSFNANPCDFLINGISSNHYCIDLNAESEIPRGVNYDTNVLEVEGADGEFANKVNIRNKKLKLKFNAYGDDFLDSTELLKYVSEFLYPKRNKLDKPLLKNISFFFDKENCYDYYIEDTIDCEAMVGGYDCEVDLIVPSGVSRSINPVEKSFAGDTGHIGKIKPIITFYKQMNNANINQIRLIDMFSSQVFILQGEFIENLPDGTLLKLDCLKRELYYMQYNEWFPINNNCISLDSDFFVLNGSYNFESSINCRIREVNYHEIMG